MEVWDLKLLALLKFENIPLSNCIICKIGKRVRSSMYCPAANRRWVLTGSLPSCVSPETTLKAELRVGAPGHSTPTSGPVPVVVQRPPAEAPEQLMGQLLCFLVYKPM